MRSCVAVEQGVELPGVAKRTECIPLKRANVEQSALTAKHMGQLNQFL